jgi:hypothetical protein
LVDSQLTSMIAGQFDNINKAMGTIERTSGVWARLGLVALPVDVATTWTNSSPTPPSTARIAALKNDFNSMSESCDRTHGQLGSFEHIRAINIANRNINTTISRIDNFTRIPQKVKRLMSALEQNPNSLMVVYKEVSKGRKGSSRCGRFQQCRTLSSNRSPSPFPHPSPPNRACFRLKVWKTGGTNSSRKSREEAAVDGRRGQDTLTPLRCIIKL